MSWDSFPLLYESYSPRVQSFSTNTKLLTTIGKTYGTSWSSLEGKEVGTGSTVEIRGTLYDENYNLLAGGREIKVYHKLGTADFALLETVKTDKNSNFLMLYKLEDEGAHRFVCDFEGDAEYNGSKGLEMTVYATSALPPYPEPGISKETLVAGAAFGVSVLILGVALVRRAHT